MQTLDDFIISIKRSTGYGTIGTTTDQSTSDILRSINRRRNRIARAWPWDWLLKSFTITTVSSQKDYTIDSDISRVMVISDGSGDRPRKLSFKDYMSFYKASDGGSDAGSLFRYMHIGRNTSTGARKIRLVYTPTTSKALECWGLKNFTRFVTSDIAAQANFLPFPDESIDVLEEFVIGDILRCQQKWTEHFAQLGKAESELERLKSEDQSDPADDVTSALPDFYLRKKIGRRNGRCV